jgi:putative FmdB family regulatory protein
MPIFEFRCQICGHLFEELVFRQGEIEELSCPKCGARQISQLLSSFAPAGSAKSSGGSSSGSCGPGSFS